MSPRAKRNYEHYDLAYQVIFAAGYRGWLEVQGYGPNSLAKARKHLRKRILRYDFVPRRGTALELGCGDGIMSVALGRHGFTARGIDVSPTVIRKAREQARRLAAEVRFQVGDVTDMPAVRSGSVDLALDMNCLHILTESSHRLAMLREARRVLKPDGVLYITTMATPMSPFYQRMMEEDETLRSGQRFEVTKQVRGKSVTYAMPLVKRAIYSKERILGDLLAAGLTPVRWQHRKAATISDLHVWAIRDDSDLVRPARRLDAYRYRARSILDE